MGSYTAGSPRAARLCSAMELWDSAAELVRCIEDWRLKDDACWSRGRGLLDMPCRQQIQNGKGVPNGKGLHCTASTSSRIRAGPPPICAAAAHLPSETVEKAESGCACGRLASGSWPESPLLVSPCDSCGDVRPPPINAVIGSGGGTCTAQFKNFNFLQLLASVCWRLAVSGALAGAPHVLLPGRHCLDARCVLQARCGRFCALYGSYVSHHHRGPAPPEARNWR